MITELGLEGRVELPGFVRDTDCEYVRASIFVLPSRYESFGMVVAEALGYGLPVVAFANCLGANEIVANGCNGILVDGPEREQALANGLARLIRDPETRACLGAAGPASIERFKTETVVRRWETLLQQVSRGIAGP